MKPDPLFSYLAATAAWFLAWGMQSVIFAWLVALELGVSPALVGFAQMALLLPGTFLILFGGGLADHFGGRRVAVAGHAAAALAPLLLSGLILSGNLGYVVMLGYAVLLGSAAAMITPARDGLLNQVAGGRVQRTVMLTSMIQFAVQLAGFLLASLADYSGAVPVLLMQAAALAAGALAFWLLDAEEPASRPALASPLRQLAGSIVQGFVTVKASPAMRAVVVQNSAMGIFFMGSYMVTLPVLVREVYAGTSMQLSWLNAANSLGLVVTILILLRFGDLHRQGRALLVAQGVGALVLASAGSGPGFYLVALAIFAWGMCGGVAMTMSRTIMQEHAPVDQRGRIMAFFSFSFMGSGPVGAVVCGALVSLLGAERALVVASASMLLVVAVVGCGSSLWRLDARRGGLQHQGDPGGAGHGPSRTSEMRSD